MTESGRIPLTRGCWAIVDAEDFDRLNQHKWQRARAGYAARSVRVAGRKIAILMHREILGLVEGDGILCDHMNGDGLDNRRSNLRTATSLQNQRNIRSSKNQKRGGYKGVWWDKSRKKWAATIRFDGRTRHLGRFDDPAEAARTYDRAASELFGEFASLNFEDGQVHVRKAG